MIILTPPLHDGCGTDKAKHLRAWVGLILVLPVALCCACDSSPPACLKCENCKLTNTWCDDCKVGYVAGVNIANRMLFECLDAHGHELVLSAVTCETCRSAIGCDGYCETCRIGWVDDLAYFSRLTYHLAKGKPCDPGTLDCASCRKNSKSCGWCSSCGVGMVGNVVVPRRADFDGGRRGFELMRAAIEASKRCEACALAIMADTFCFYCRVTYKDGKRVGDGPIGGAAGSPGG